MLAVLQSGLWLRAQPKSHAGKAKKGSRTQQILLHSSKSNKAFLSKRILCWHCCRSNHGFRDCSMLLIHQRIIMPTYVRTFMLCCHDHLPQKLSCPIMELLLASRWTDQLEMVPKTSCFLLLPASLSCSRNLHAHQHHHCMTTGEV